MAVSDETMARVRKWDRHAAEEVLAECYPVVHRVAHVLIGDATAAGRVTQHVLRQGMRVMPGWRKGLIPENWFYHHTLLAVRETAPRQPPSPDRDLLVTAGPTGEPSYVAFVRAIRSLPGQQMEAFVLHQGEKLNPRLLGVAMDCSTQAAANHLAAAMETLRSIAGDNFSAHADALHRACMSLSPPAALVRSGARSQVGRALWRRRFRRLIRRLVILALLAGIAYAAWRWRDPLMEWFNTLRSKATTKPS